MRIGIITPFYYPNVKGGSEVSVKLLAEKLLERGHEVTVISFDSNLKLNYGEKVADVLVYRYKVLFPIALLLTLSPYTFRVMRKWDKKVDIFHIYGVYPIAGAAFYKLLCGKKRVIATLNNYSAFCPIGTVIYGCTKCTLSTRYRCLRELETKQFSSVTYSIFFPFLKWLCKRLDRYIALSCVVKQLYVSYGFDERKICVIPNFFDFESIPASKAKKAVGKKFNILFMGSLTKSKGVDVLIKAFNKVSIKNPRLSLTIIGDGEEMNNLKKLVNSFNLENQVTFTGYIKGNERFAYLLNADIFVHPGAWPEPFGRTILESMLAKLAVITSDKGAPPAILGDAGMVFEAGNVDQLAAALTKLINDPVLRLKMGEKAFNKVLKDYNSEKIMTQIMGEYQKLVKSSFISKKGSINAI